jgi:molybdopterin converting factor small subunit
MAILRLFAGLRDAAGMSKTAIEGATVADVLDEASRRFGASFTAGLVRSRIWVNGEEATGDTSLTDTDEVAVLPPVSGGSQTITPPAIGVAGLVGVTALILLVVADVFGTEAWYSAVVVGVLSLWALDVATVMSERGRDLPVVPVLFTVTVAVVASRLLGTPGLAVTAVVAVMAPMVWGVVSETGRLIHIVGPAGLVSFMAGVAAASMLLVRYQAGGSLPEPSVEVFLTVATISTIAGMVFDRFRGVAFGDPFTVVALAAVLAALVAAAIWDLEMSTFLLVGVVLALGLVAGRALGSIIRTGSTSLIDQPPGLGWPLDGAVLAAVVLHPVLAILT